MTPTERYEAELARGELSPDPVQAMVVGHLQRLHEAFLEPPPPAPGGLLGRLTGRFAAARPAPVRGLYLWGGVGRGKTHLVNGFYDALPFQDKLRVHFHRFMQHVHGELRGLRSQSDPLNQVAAGITESTRVLCFDEFHVSDITDAMLLARLLELLFDGGVSLVATSNVAPRDLYRDGLQRQRFVPAIELIERHTEVVHLDGGTDYRLRALERAEIYHCPLDGEAEASLQRSFHSLAPENVIEGEVLLIEGRPVNTVRVAEGIAWFGFRELCETARSTADYIEIARCFHTVFLERVPRMGAEDSDKARRFIHLVDEFYERNVNLVLSADAPPEELYEGKRLAFEFQRTASRLQEMQSHDFLARLHLP